MLYHFHEFQHAVWAPFRMMANATRRIHRHPMMPLSHTAYGRSVAAICELFERGTWRPEKPDFRQVMTVIDNEEVAVHEEVVLDRPFCRLLHFRRDTPRDDPRILLVAPMSGHYATLLRGTVAGLLPAHDVYITDWKNARDVPLTEGGFDLDDYIDYVIGMLRLLGSDGHVIAVCQPAVPVLAAVSLAASAGDAAVPRSMVLMGGPIDTRINPTEVNRLAEQRPLGWFERSVIATVPAIYPGAMRRVYPGFVQLSGFMTMNLDRHVGAHLRLFEHLVDGDGDSAAAHRRFYDEYLSVMDLTAEFFLQTVRTVFQEHALPRNRMTWRGQPVEPQAIHRTALMTVEGEHDDISGVGQTRAAHHLCTGLAADQRRHYEQPGVGHYGIFNGRRWHAEIMPRVHDFIREHDRRQPG